MLKREIFERKKSYTVLVYWSNEYLIVVGGGDWVSWVSNPIYFDGRTEVDEILTAQQINFGKEQGELDR